MSTEMGSNLERVLLVGRQLGDFARKVVFAGGAVTELLITDPGMAEVRTTVDVDIIVEIISRSIGVQEKLK